VRRRDRAIDHICSAGSRISGTYEFDAREHPSLFVDMERNVFNTDHARVIRKAIAKLSENQRTVIKLACYEGLSQTEMAEKMGQPLGTIKTWARSALKILRGEPGQDVHMNSNKLSAEYGAFALGAVESAAAMAISIEKEGGSAQPTTTPIIVSKL
jgi:DNA-directed RNA polymerase specialized sigma24 family protein